MKSRSLSWFRLVVAGVFVAQAACVGTSVGNPPGADASPVQIAVVGESDATKIAPTAAGAVTINEAWIVLRDVGLMRAGTCSKGVASVDFEGPVAANLLTGELLPEAPSWQRDVGETYCALRTQVKGAGAEIAGAPANLVDAGIFVAGARGDGTPFELRSDLDSDLQLGAPGKAEFALEEGPVGLLLTFDINTWVSPSLLNQAEVKNGVIKADNGNNAAIAEDAKQKIPGSAKLLRDKNRNGALDPEDGAL